ncbi:hypothetical protein D5S18_26460 [Nocardia panacis]|uniref:Uncharacterized protein n=1 Tax=Nocardia panacis TaxID=2340916 RepID=A0A3A4KE66_9NOCA|nr:hypothetical protein D5S18_26460 [Nocardia panacis]
MFSGRVEPREIAPVISPGLDSVGRPASAGHGATDCIAVTGSDAGEHQFRVGRHCQVTDSAEQGVIVVVLGDLQDVYAADRGAVRQVECQAAQCKSRIGCRATCLAVRFVFENFSRYPGWRVESPVVLGRNRFGARKL